MGGWCMIMGLLCSLCNIAYISYSIIHEQHDARVRGDTNDSLLHPQQGRKDQRTAKINYMDLQNRVVQTLPPEWNIQKNEHTSPENDPIRQLLVEALGNEKQQTLDAETMQRLPTVQDVISLYGSTPVVLGLETCEQFQYHNTIMDAAEHLVAVAGSFNTGTNLLAELLIANCFVPARQQKYGTHGVRWQVLWGKHTPVDDETFRQSHRTYKNDTGPNKEPPIFADAMFPAVTIRDPFKWMQSVRWLLWLLLSCSRFLWWCFIWSVRVCSFILPSCCNTSSLLSSVSFP
jgi:hypothetical protein